MSFKSFLAFDKWRLSCCGWYSIAELFFYISIGFCFLWFSFHVMIFIELGQVLLCYLYNPSLKNHHKASPFCWVSVDFLLRILINPKGVISYPIALGEQSLCYYHLGLAMRYTFLCFVTYGSIAKYCRCYKGLWIKSNQAKQIEMERWLRYTLRNYTLSMIVVRSAFYDSHFMTESS